MRLASAVICGPTTRQIRASRARKALCATMRRRHDRTSPALHPEPPICCSGARSSDCALSTPMDRSRASMTHDQRNYPAVCGLISRCGRLPPSRGPVVQRTRRSARRELRSDGSRDPSHLARSHRDSRSHRYTELSTSSTARAASVRSFYPASTNLFRQVVVGPRRRGCRCWCLPAHTRT
jgi:hypothetical protein